MTAHDPAIVLPADDLLLERDARGSLVHVRNRKTCACVGCVEAGLFDVLRHLILAEKNLRRWS